ncbi:hypothetical protein B2I20_13635 [Bacillus stratosphericus]|nr:hypothetical protein B2I20_13635 [Bacillus stratosphericus]
MRFYVYFIHFRDETKERAARPQAPRPKPPDLTNKTCAQFFKLGVLGAFQNVYPKEIPLFPDEDGNVFFVIREGGR